MAKQAANTEKFFAPRRLGHANLFVSNYEQSADFYKSVVGFEEVYRQPDNQARIKKAVVTLPAGLFANVAALQTLCTVDQAAVFACPSAGTVAWKPVCCTSRSTYAPLNVTGLGVPRMTGGPSEAGGPGRSVCASRERATFRI